MPGKYYNAPRATKNACKLMRIVQNAVLSIWNLNPLSTTGNGKSIFLNRKTPPSPRSCRTDTDVGENFLKHPCWGNALHP